MGSTAAKAKAAGRSDDNQDVVTRGNPSVVVLDEDELFRSGLVALLQERGIRVLSEACSASDAVAQASEQRPDVVLIDLSVDGMSGIAATRQLTSASPPVRVVVLTAVATDQHVIDALLAGASGYLLKDAPIEQIIEGIVAAVRGESMLSPRIAGRLVARLREPARGASALPAAEFTERQLEVLRLVARGISNQEIAKALFLSEHTVKNHVSTILVKLGADNRIQAAVRAVRARIVE